MTINIVQKLTFNEVTIKVRVSCSHNRNASKKEIMSVVGVFISVATYPQLQFLWTGTWGAQRSSEMSPSSGLKKQAANIQTCFSSVWPNFLTIINFKNLEILWSSMSTTLRFCLVWVSAEWKTAGSLFLMNGDRQWMFSAVFSFFSIR